MNEDEILNNLYGFASFMNQEEPYTSKVENSTRKRTSIKDILKNQNKDIKSATPEEVQEVIKDFNSTVAISNNILESKVKAKILIPLSFILANANMTDICNPSFRMLRMNAEAFLSVFKLKISKHPNQSLRRVIDPIDEFLDILNPNYHIAFLYDEHTKEVTIYHNLDKPTAFFCQLPYKIINNQIVDRGLSSVYLALDYCDRTNKRYAGVEYISSLSGMDIRKCRKMLKELERLNLITITKEKGKPNSYRLTDTTGTYLYSYIDYVPIVK